MLAYMHFILANQCMILAYMYIILANQYSARNNVDWGLSSDNYSLVSALHKIP